MSPPEAKRGGGKAPTRPRPCQQPRVAATLQPYRAGGSSPKGVGVTLIPALGNPSAVNPKNAWTAEVEMLLKGAGTSEGVVQMRCQRQQ